MTQQLIQENLKNIVDPPLILGLFKFEQIGPERRITACPEIRLLEGATYYQGKVRANFYGGRLLAGDVPLRVIVATDQISTHDIVRGTIPFKGQVLTAISNAMFENISGLIPSSQIYVAGPNTVVAENCTPINFEMVLRAYMAKSTTETSLYHHYVKHGKREFCGHQLPDNLVPDGPLPYTMDTPSTKARDKAGVHDESVAPEYLFEHGIVTPVEYTHIKNATMEDFRRISALLEQKGIITADTKFELGVNSKGEIVYIDEVMTPDASRFWLAEDYEEKMQQGQDPTSYSKQIARDIGEVGEQYTDEQRAVIGTRFIETYELLMGKPFQPDLRLARQAIVEDINIGLAELVR